MSRKKYMECGTTRPRRECPFMTLDGCTWPGGCQPILVLCEGCGRIEECPDGLYCNATPQPLLKWGEHKKCNMATHIQRSKVVSKTKMNPLKASKKKRKKNAD